MTPCCSPAPARWRALPGPAPGADLSQVKALCIGPQTAQRAQALSMQTQVAPQATIQSMIETLMGGNEPC